MAKILILLNSTCHSAPGKVFSYFLSEMTKCAEHNYTLITRYDYHLLSETLETIVVPPQREVPYKLYKLLMILFRKSYLHFFWKKTVVKTVIQLSKKDNFDLVITFASASSESIIQAGYLAKDLFDAKYYIHLVDPIPPPSGWENIEIYRKNKLFGVKKELEGSDLLSLSNNQMRIYQLELLNRKPKSFTLSNPTHSDVLIDIDRMNIKKEFNYLFLGTLNSGARKSDKLFEAFSMILKNHEDSFFYVYGAGHRVDITALPTNLREHVFMNDWAENIEDIIERCDVFIDLDGDLDDDVFISSKLQVYLSYNRPILSITGNHSPSRELLSPLSKSVIISNFEVEKIAQSLIDIRNIKIDEDFREERNLYLERNSPQYLTGIMLGEIDNLL